LRPAMPHLQWHQTHTFGWIVMGHRKYFKPQDFLSAFESKTHSVALSHGRSFQEGKNIRLVR
jgi:hypothetical protein